MFARRFPETIIDCPFDPENCPYRNEVESPIIQVGNEFAFRGKVYDCHWKGSGPHVINICGKTATKTWEVPVEPA